MAGPDPMATTEWHVGAETDAAARARLSDALRACGYRIDAGSWALGGSQELSAWTARRPDGELRIAAETYVGITVRGEKARVEALRAAFSSPAGDAPDNSRPR